jgi:hypothetical protein
MVDLEQIHELVTKFIYCLDLFYFLCLVLFLNTKAENYKSFTNVSKFFLNIYIFGLFTLIIIHNVAPGILCKIFTNNFKAFTRTYGKVIITSVIALIYIGSSNTSECFFGILVIISNIAILALNFMINKNVDNSDRQNMSKHENNQGDGIAVEVNISNSMEEKEKSEKDKKNENEPYNSQSTD